jgi:hypothetical protein
VLHMIEKIAPEIEDRVLAHLHEWRPFPRQRSFACVLGFLQRMASASLGEYSASGSILIGGIRRLHQ